MMRKLRESSSLRLDSNRQKFNGTNSKEIARLFGKSSSSKRKIKQQFKNKQNEILRWLYVKNRNGMSRSWMVWNSVFTRLSAKILICRDN